MKRNLYLELRIKEILKKIFEIQFASKEEDKRRELK